MNHEHDRRRSDGGPRPRNQDHEPPGKRTLTEGLGAQPHQVTAASAEVAGVRASPTSSAAPTTGGYRPTLQMLFGVQRTASAAPVEDPGQVHAAAARGTASPVTRLPHAEALQRSFGRHDISAIQAHTGDEAAASARDMGAHAYASGNHVVLGRATDLFTVAHEAAHVVQQRAGLRLEGGVGAAGDPYEQHADAVASLVVQGKSAEALLARHAPPADGAGDGAGLQRSVQRVQGDEIQRLERRIRTELELQGLERTRESIARIRAAVDPDGAAPIQVALRRVPGAVAALRAASGAQDHDVVGGDGADTGGELVETLPPALPPALRPAPGREDRRPRGGGSLTGRPNTHEQTWYRPPSARGRDMGNTSTARPPARTAEAQDDDGAGRAGADIGGDRVEAPPPALPSAELPSTSGREDEPPRDEGSEGGRRERKSDRKLYTRPGAARVREVFAAAAARPPARDGNAEAREKRTAGCEPVLANLRDAKITFARSAYGHLIRDGDGQAGLTPREAEHVVHTATEISHGHRRNDGTPSYVVEYIRERRMCIAFATADDGVNCEIVHVGPGYLG